MKKQPKKLVLSKETVKTLAENQITDLVLGGVSGGYASCIIRCFYSQQASCLCLLAEGSWPPGTRGWYLYGARHG